MQRIAEARNRWREFAGSGELVKALEDRTGIKDKLKGRPLQSEELDAVSARLGTSRMAVALAWLLQRSPNILLIPGTSSVTHLRENVAGAGVSIPADELARLDGIGA